MRQVPVKGFENYEITDDGRIWSHYRGIWMKTKKDRDGYMRINFRRNGAEKAFGVHRLVAEAFVPNPDNLPEVNHKNGLRDDNRYQNLEWCIHADNSGSLKVNKKRCDKPHPRVGKFDKDGNLLGIYDTYTAAANSLTSGGKLNTKINHISQRCNNAERSRYYLGYFWMFVEEDAYECSKLENCKS